jgi:hypothetical protein
MSRKNQAKTKERFAERLGRQNARFDFACRREIVKARFPEEEESGRFAQNDGACVRPGIRMLAVAGA